MMLQYNIKMLEIGHWPTRRGIVAQAGQRVGWIRPRTGAGAWLALIALALQTVLAFGHGHFGLHDDGSYASRLIAASSSHLPGPGRDDGDGLGPDGCAICATMALAATALAAAPPPLTLPSPVVAPEQPWRRTVAMAATIDAPFRSRAPPLLIV